jgi:LPS-assembly lipoprotein
LRSAGLALVAMVALGLSGCGLQPVYSGGSSSPAAKMLTQISIAPIPDRAGFLVRQDLIERFGDTVADPRYRLEIELDDQIIAFGVRGDNSSARERRILRARYRLVLVATNTVVVDATAASDAGIDRVSSNYAVVAAETTALERLATDIANQITARMAQYAKTVPITP